MDTLDGVLSLCSAIERSFVSQACAAADESDANVVDGLFAIAYQVRRVADALERGTGIDVDELSSAVCDGTRQAFSAGHIEQSIKEGVDQAFGVYPSQVLNAIADGTREALKNRDN